MLTIYGADLSAPANKVRFVANELGLEYEYKQVNLREGEQRRPEFLALNPIGKVPVIDDDGFAVFESNAIIKYLARKTSSPLYPADIRQQAQVDAWLDFATTHVGGAMSKVLYNRVFALVRGIAVDEMSLADGIKFLNRFLPVVDNRLGQSPWLAGEEMTLADFNLLAVLDPTEVAGIDLTPYANITRWRDGMRRRPAYTRCHAEYGLSLKETLARKEKES